MKSATLKSASGWAKKVNLISIRHPRFAHGWREDGQKGDAVRGRIAGAERVAEYNGPVIGLMKTILGDQIMQLKAKR